jgi:hypothetical protein
MDSQHVPESTESADFQASVRAGISREMVRLYKEQFGRGPTKARTEFAGPDIVICTLEDTSTPAEKRLAEMGEHQRLRDTRLYFQHATKRSASSKKSSGARSAPSTAASTRTPTSRWRSST